MTEINIHASGGQGLNGKSLLLLTLTFFVLFVLSFAVLASAQTGTIVWSDKMNYQSLAQMQAAGWTTSNPSGVNFTSTGVVVDDYSGDTSITYSGSGFPSGLSNWQVEDQSRWVSGPHCGNSVGASTAQSSFEFAADGWYSQFILYVDGSIVWRSNTGTFSESQNTLFTLTMIKSGDKLECYYNGQLKYTYSTQDSSQLTSVSTVSPWEGGSEYDYFQISSLAGSSSSASGSILSNPVAVGGIGGGVAVGVGAGVGLAIHFGVIGGGAAGSASAGSSAAATGAAGSASGSSGSGGGAAGSSGAGGGSGGSDGGSGGGGGGTSDSNLVAQASNAEMQQATTPAQMQQATANQDNAQNIVNQMDQANQNTQNQSGQTQQDAQTKITQTQQDVTVNKQKGQQKNAESMDQYIRASTDSDSTVAEDSGSSGTG
jgi:hypothetical protein